jgi:hypothetical protein
MKLINIYFGENKRGGDIYSLNLMTFPEFIAQLAYKCFSGPPLDKRGTHLGNMVETLF